MAAATPFSPHPLVACYPELANVQQTQQWARTLDLGGKLPQLDAATVIGITVAISGNVLISLALNLQKLAHKRVEAKKLARRELAAATPSDTPHTDGISEADEDAYSESPAEDVPLAPAFQLRVDYGSTSSTDTVNGTDAHKMSGVSPKKTLLANLFRSKRQRTANGISSERTSLIPVDVLTEEEANGPQRPKRKPEDEPAEFDDWNESDYLKTKLWWFGFALMNVGEIGNFISYAWAPASVVAPLGTFALMANCVFAPLMLGERFRKSDLLGILIAVIGAITVVLASNASDTRLDPDALLVAISQTPFIVYTGVYVAGIVILSILSEGKAGRTFVFVDVGLCALFGGFTVLSTKAISTLLTMEWFEMFTKWITYPTIAVLAGTGVGQIRYLNRALMRFDGKVVIPIQFVLFTMSAIIGSAILYGDFKKATFHQLVTFLYGCAATFTGVFILAWEPPRGDDEAPTPPDDSEDQEGTESEEDNGHVVGPNIPVRKRPALILPNGFREQQLQNRQSTVGLLTLSPARPLLMVHTPPREIPDRFRERDAERDPQTPPNGSHRRRTLSHADGMRRSARNGSLARNGSIGRFSLSGGLPRSNSDTVTTPASSPPNRRP
ncbi:magnesium transporter NIPA-domain-containing protein [Mycena galopus ATCC 62051]|nr:magnesium transporter NIPA-domain-containing protein [Mycena galopus ATCC 62051]